MHRKNRTGCQPLISSETKLSSSILWSEIRHAEVGDLLRKMSSPHRLKRRQWSSEPTICPHGEEAGGPILLIESESRASWDEKLVLEAPGQQLTLGRVCTDPTWLPFHYPGLLVA